MTFWSLLLSSFADKDQQLRRTCCLYLQSRRVTKLCHLVNRLYGITSHKTVISFTTMQNTDIAKIIIYNKYLSLSLLSLSLSLSLFFSPPSEK